MHRPPSLPLLALGVVTLLVPAFVVACKKTPAMTVPSCQALLSAGAATIDSAERAANAKAKCDADSDCIESPSAKCLVGCSGHAIPKVVSPSFASAVRTVDGEQCKRWKDGDCDSIAPQPMPSCPRYTPRCKEHACTMVDARFLSVAECEDLYSRAQKGMLAAIASGETTCKRDADCTQSKGEPSCLGGCGGAAVSTKGAPSLDGELERLATETCVPWVSGGCRETTPKAVASCAPLIVRCDKGRCVNGDGSPRR